MEEMSKRVRPWTDSLDLNQLKQTCDSQSNELSRANIHLQTLRTKITQLEYELGDTQKVIYYVISIYFYWYSIILYTGNGVSKICY